jgi:hypothetical protein
MMGVMTNVNVSTFFQRRVEQKGEFQCRMKTICIAENNS